MRTFIFITDEGSTLTPMETDIENLQVLGVASGTDEKDAFLELTKENPHLKFSGFKDVIGLELASEIQHLFSLEVSR